ncbi:hypothetical protein Fcan01_24073 [Folsomia candida]|uniref:Uncharacterized protein n=1 Tax=Folsomia candida TaxID=158441 RepID=A0A226D7X7_FOLCA|nr:hypothetical protein Fcan01_24073 [Folsomia candida]
MKIQLKFKFVKFHSKPIPFERHDVQIARHSFLMDIKHLRNQNYNIFYTDETWANESQSPTRGWHLPDAEVLGMGRNNATHVDQWLKGVGRRFADGLIGNFYSKLQFKNIPNFQGSELIRILTDQKLRINFSH